MILKLINSSDGNRLVTIRFGEKRSFIPLVSGDFVSIEIPDSASFHVSRALSLEDASALLLRKRRSFK